MSATTKTRMPYAEALVLAEQIVEKLAPGVERIAIAGSLRRHKLDIGDIELVAIPKQMRELDMFGGLIATGSALDVILAEQPWRAIKNGQCYKQFDIEPCMLDLFIATPEKWGCVFTIRTGSAEFSHRLVTKKRLGGLCPAYMSFNDGRLWNNGIVQPTPEEADVFRLLGIDWIAPEKREK